MMENETWFKKVIADLEAQGIYARGGNKPVKIVSAGKLASAGIEWSPENHEEWEHQEKQKTDATAIGDMTMEEAASMRRAVMVWSSVIHQNKYQNEVTEYLIKLLEEFRIHLNDEMLIKTPKDKWLVVPSQEVFDAIHERREQLGWGQEETE